MNQNYYPIDFQVQYEETNQKIIQLSKTYREKIISIQPDSVENLQLELQKIKIEVEDRGLQFHKESIYSQFASGQLMAEKRKNPPQMCPECGDEVKKQVQCQFCAQLFCKKCCSRHRVIPFVSKEVRLCCEQCHAKFVKLFDNKQFYEQKQKLVNVINFLRTKTLKVAEKISAKSNQIQQVRAEKRNQRIKQKNVDNKILQEEKKIKQLQDELKRIIAQKAERIKQQQQNKRIQEEQLAKARQAEEERKRQQQLNSKQRQRFQQQARSKQRFQERSIVQNQVIQKLRNSAANDLLLRKEEEIRKREEELQKKQQQLKAFQQQKLRIERQMKAFQEEKLRAAKNVRNSNHSAQSKEQIKKSQTPKQSLDKDQFQKQKNIDTADSKSFSRSRKSSEQISMSKQLLSNKNKEQLRNGKVVQQSFKSIKEQKLNQQIQKSPNQASKKEENKEIDSLEKSLANMFKPKKQDDTKSIYSNMSKSALDMTVNQLLAVRIPVITKANSFKQEPIQQQHQSASVSLLTQSRNQEQQILPRKTVERISTQIIKQNQIEQEEIRMHKNSILQQSSSLITNNKESVTDMPGGNIQKCKCEIM